MCLLQLIGETSALRGNILVVDDGEAVRKLVCEMLRRQGYGTLEACDGLEALQVLDGGGDSVQLVIADLVMPNMGGSQLAERLALTNPDLRILIMSGHSDEPIVRYLAEAGLFLAKPFSATRLEDKVSEVLTSPWCGVFQSTPGGA
jgi:CheY-like chemotaxis protein